MVDPGTLNYEDLPKNIKDICTEEQWNQFCSSLIDFSKWLNFMLNKIHNSLRPALIEFAEFAKKNGYLKEGVIKVSINTKQVIETLDKDPSTKFKRVFPDDGLVLKAVGINSTLKWEPGHLPISLSDKWEKVN